jgi:Recombinase
MKNRNSRQPPGPARQPRAAKVTSAERSKQLATRLRPLIRRMQAAGIETLTGLAAALNERGIATPQNRKWHPTSVKRLLDRLGDL